VTSGLPILSIVMPLVTLVPLAAVAGSNTSWEGTWSGSLKTGDMVSVTIAGGKVVGYSIRGAEPFPIQYSEITARTISFGDHQNYWVKLIKENDRTAFGTAHSPAGDGSASLTKQ